MIPISHLFEISIRSENFSEKANKKLKKKYRDAGTIVSTLKSKWKFFKKNKPAKTLKEKLSKKSDNIEWIAPRYVGKNAKQRQKSLDRDMMIAIQHFRRR